LAKNLHHRFPTESNTVISAFAKLFTPKSYLDSILNFGHDKLDVLLKQYGGKKVTTKGKEINAFVDEDRIKATFRHFLLYAMAVKTDR
jgi:hypothetical protein